MATIDFLMALERETIAMRTAVAVVAELDLWLWGRGVVSSEAVAGDADLVDCLRAIAVEATQ